MAKPAWSKVTDEHKQNLIEQVEKANDDFPLSPEHTAAYLGMSPATLQKWRCENPDLLPFVKIGRRAVGYIKKVVVAFGCGESVEQFLKSA